MQESYKKTQYSAFKAKDSRFDGQFFVGISSTGIYCRPICRARLPKVENCTFYLTAAEAEQAGYHPCLLCRPELAPGNGMIDATSLLAARAEKVLKENCGSGQSVKEFAEMLGCSPRHLHRIFTNEYKISPVQYLQTCKLLLAKNLLTDTNLSVLEVAMFSGFGSLRRFNALFKKQYRLSPTALRRQIPKEKISTDNLTLAIGYRPPYQWNQMLDFLSQRAISGVEVVRDDKYFRTVHLITTDKKHISGWIEVSQKSQKNVLLVTLSSSLLPVLSQVLTRVRHLFDLSCDPYTIYEALASLNEIRPNSLTLGTRLPGCFDSYEMSIRAILGQQITVKTASTLAARFVKAYGTPIETPVEGLTHIFPSSEVILSLEGSIDNHLGPLGITSARSKTILELSRQLTEDKINLNSYAQAEVEIEKLISITGIGNWTAQYIAMRTLGWTDAFLETDVGLKKALHPHTAKEMLALAEKWRPWRSYVTINLWNSLSNNEK